MKAPLHSVIVISSSHGIRRFIFYLVLCLDLALPCALAQAAYRVELNASAPLQGLLSEYLDLFRYRNRQDINDEQLNFMIATAAGQVAQLASTEGYFSSRTTVETSRDGGMTIVRLMVDSGSRTIVSALDIAVTGEAGKHSASQVEQIHRSWALQAGEPFRQEDWANAKQGGLQILQRRRYPAARIDGSEARIQANSQTAELVVRYDSGPLFTLGEPKVVGTSRYPDSIIRNVNPLHVGEEYSVDRLFEFQRQILRTPYFSNVAVDIDKTASDATLAPVSVQVTEFPTQRLRGGVGYTTDTGAHVDGRYSHNNLFGRAWVLDTHALFEQRRQSGLLELAMPPGRAGFVNSVHGSVERTTLEGVDLRSRRAGVRRSRSMDNADVAYSIEYYRDSLQQLNGAALPPDTVVQPGNHQALVAGIDRTWRQVDSLVFPRNGHTVSIQTGVALKGLLTDQSFFRLYGRSHHYLPVGKRDLVILRAELGAILSQHGNTSIPASQLFRTGGTDSVRGYGFQSIGNKRGGTVYPTRFLATGGAEYQHWFSGQWGNAVFYDVGTATDTWRDKTLFHAVGAGVRWRSLVGRVNVDLAYGFRDNKIRPHLSLGVAF